MILQARYLSLCLISGLLLSACASWPQHGVHPSQGGKYPIAVLPIQVTAEVDKLSDIIGQHEAVADEKAEIRTRMQAVAEQLSDILQHKLSAGSGFIITPLKSMPGLSSDLALPEPGQTWTRKDFLRLGVARDAQAILLVRLAGYGKLKRQWVTILIGTGIIEGVVQGVVAARVLNNTTVGLAVGLEEIAQEYLTWGGGAYLFDSYFAPVTLQAELISTSDGKSIWNKTIFVSVDRKAIDRLPENQRNRERQLQLTAIKAVDELSKSLESTAQDNLPSDTSPEQSRGDNTNLTHASP